MHKLIKHKCKHHVKMHCLNNVSGTRLTAIFSHPEPWSRGNADTTAVGHIPSMLPPAFPVYSVYCGRMRQRRPAIEVVEYADIVVIDRKTLARCAGGDLYLRDNPREFLEAAAKAEIPVLGSDRPNSGHWCNRAGTVVDAGMRLHQLLPLIPVRHRMTNGELRRCSMEELGIHASFPSAPCMD